jgi:hypothetical protein
MIVVGKGPGGFLDDDQIKTLFIRISDTAEGGFYHFNRVKYRIESWGSEMHQGGDSDTTLESFQCYLNSNVNPFNRNMLDVVYCDEGGLHNNTIYINNIYEYETYEGDGAHRNRKGSRKKKRSGAKRASKKRSRRKAKV